VKFSKPSAVVIRHEMGNANAGDVLVAKQGVTQLLQNPESFGNFWDQVEATETLWETKAWILCGYKLEL